MYKIILLTLDGTPTDRAIIEHIKPLAKLTQGSVVLLHVADGWAARTYGPDAISREITETLRIWKRFAPNFNPKALTPRPNWLTANPAMRSSNGSRKRGCDLVAMSTHGHGFLADLFLGSASRHVRHSIRVPVPFCCERSNSRREARLYLRSMIND